MLLVLCVVVHDNSVRVLREYLMDWFCYPCRDIFWSLRGLNVLHHNISCRLIYPTGLVCDSCREGVALHPNRDKQGRGADEILEEQIKHLRYSESLWSTGPNYQ